MTLYYVTYTTFFSNRSYNVKLRRPAHYTKYHDGHMRLSAPKRCNANAIRRYVLTPVLLYDFDIIDCAEMMSLTPYIVQQQKMCYPTIALKV